MMYSVAEHLLAKSFVDTGSPKVCFVFGRNQTQDAGSDKNIHTNTQQGLYTNRSPSGNIMGCIHSCISHCLFVNKQERAT